jgi:hypothetical protein
MAEAQKESPAYAARRLVRCARKAALGTIDRRGGHPYASLVTVCTDTEGTPAFLISRLAYHTQNLAADPRASLLIDGTSSAGDPLAGGRVTLIGEARAVDDPAIRRRFLERHPGARVYADFADFGFVVLRPTTAHYVGGFGRIVDLPAADLLLEPGRCRRIGEAEAEIVAHMNADHADAVALYATRLLAAPGGDWRMTGIDPEGIDIANGNDMLRLDFDAPVESPAEARQALVRLAALARSRPALQPGQG